MRIVHIYKDYFPVKGGIENHIRQLAEAQVRRGHDVTVLVAQLRGLPATEELTNGVRVVKLRRQLDVQSAPISLSLPEAVRRWTSGADIAHLHAPYPPGELCNWLLGSASRTVITWHSDIVRQRLLLRFYAPLLRRVLRGVDGIVATSEPYMRTSPWLRPHWHKCRIVPLGVDTERFTPAHQPEVNADNLTLLSVGRLRYYKGLDDLIRALPDLPFAQLRIVGSGPMQDEWKRLAAALSVAERVHFIGDVDDAALPDCYRQADVYVIPANSRAEAFGIAILEAMASGLPVISTEVGTATSWINQHGVTGLVVPPRAPAALAEAVRTLRDPLLRRHMGEAARARVVAEFTESRMIERIEEVYRALLAHP